MKNTLRAFFLFVLICAGTQLFAQHYDGILPDKNAKAGTWSEWQSVKDSSGVEVAQYRICFKSAGKFGGGAMKCNYEVEVKSLTDRMVFVDLNYTYNQVLAGSPSSQGAKYSGMISKKGKSWTFEFSTYTDKVKGQDNNYPCFNCNLAYTLDFAVSKY